MHHRCCTDRLDEIIPWRPVVDETWTSINSLRNKTIHIQGDSLAEQHFIALLCNIWSSNDAEVASLTKTAGQKKLNSDSGIAWNAFIEPIGVSISYLRFNKPKIVPTFDYTVPTYLIVGGWHHGGMEENQLRDLFNQLEKRRRDSTTIVVEELPQHFPGGEYRRDGVYPPMIN